MKILLLSATALEIQPVTVKKTGVDILIAGVGTPATIYQLTRKLNLSAYHLVIQAGIAGSFTTALSLGDTVLVQQDRFADIGVEENGTLSDVFDMGLADSNAFPFSDGWLINNALPVATGLEAVKAVTVNKISDSKKQNDLLLEKYNPSLESMEGAGLHFVCLQQQVPFIQLRSISNYIGERDKTKWKMKDAIGNLNEALDKIIASYI